MRHVPAHRLADADAGRLAPAELARIESHLATCDGCREARQRVRAARCSLSEVAETEISDLSWDRIGAQVYWSTSRSTGRGRRAHPVRWVSFGVVASGCAVAAAIAVMTLRAPREGGVSLRPSVVRGAESVRAEPAAAPSRSEALHGAITFAQGDVRIGDEPLDLDRIIEAGDVLRTGEGRIVVQFGPKSGFAVEPGSSLAVVELSREAIELEIDGMVGVDITRRPDGQRFAVRAGSHRVVVRGTAFVVEHRDGSLDVQCARGRVEVTDGDDSVDVSAGERFHLLTSAWREAPLRTQSLSSDARTALDSTLQMALVPAFPGARAFVDGSVVHSVEGDEEQTVAVDGLAMGRGTFDIRLSPGRHHFATMESDGEWSAGRWVETSEAERTVLGHPEGVAASSARTTRKRELQRAVSGARRARRCLDPLDKHGLVEGSYAVFEIGINEDGSQRFLNVVDSNLSPAIQHCLKGAIDAVELGRGPQARFRYRLAY